MYCFFILKESVNIASYPTLQKLQCILQFLRTGYPGTERSIYYRNIKTKTQLMTCLSTKS